VFNIIVPAGAFLVAEIADTTGAGLLVTVHTVTAARGALFTVTTDFTLIVITLISTLFTGIYIVITLTHVCCARCWVGFGFKFYFHLVDERIRVSVQWLWAYILF
jgi:predicted metal-binding membrane protein